MAPHTWKFFRAGGFDQVKLESGADFVNLDQLDLKLWVALACPTQGLEFSAETVALIDEDHDGRIRASEVLGAVKWTCAMLKNPDVLVSAGDSIEIASITDATLQSAARRLRAQLGQADSATISVADVADAERIFAEAGLNGDGIITPDSADDEATRAAIADIVACSAAVPDRSGKPGVDLALVDAFFEACEAYDAWMRSTTAQPSILPVGEATAAAAAAARALRAKVDDFFGRCRLAAYDPRAAAALNRKEEEYLTVAAQDMSITAAEVSGFPLAQVAANRPLPLKSGINPAHAAAVAALHRDAVKPLLGDRDELTESDWMELQSKLAPYEEWRAAKAGSSVESLGHERVRQLLSGDARGAVAKVVAADLALEAEARSLSDLRRLLLYRRDLRVLCTNFVNFRDFYDAGEPAIFQAGTLYLDQRSCTLTLPVEDLGRHAAMAALAGSYLAYCDCVRRGSGERRLIVAAFTNGDADNLMVGRNGVFYDRKGHDWDATITKIVENPISLRQAFWSPYKKLVRMFEEEVAKRAAAEGAKTDARLGAVASEAAGSGATPSPPPKPEPRKIDIGTVAAMGVAFGAIATAFAAMAGYVSGLVKLPFWQVCLAVVGLLLLVSGPSTLIAWLKLRKRNLGPLLDANGWALNSKALLNVPFGASLTGVAKLPAGHKMSSNDRFGERPSLWPRLAMFLIVFGFLWSLLDHYYLLDAIYYGVTGQHNSAWFKTPGSPAAPGLTSN